MHQRMLRSTFRMQLRPLLTWLVAVATLLPVESALGLYGDDGPDPADSVTHKPAPHVPKRLLIKLVPTVDVALDRIAPGAAFAPQVGTGRLDDLNRRFGLLRVRPLRSADAALNS